MVIAVKASTANGNLTRLRSAWEMVTMMMDRKFLEIELHAEEDRSRKPHEGARHGAETIPESGTTVNTLPELVNESPNAPRGSTPWRRDHSQKCPDCEYTAGVSNGESHHGAVHAKVSHDGQHRDEEPMADSSTTETTMSDSPHEGERHAGKTVPERPGSDRPGRW